MKLEIQGMHCKSCKMLIEEELEDLGATNIKVAFDETTQKGSAEFSGIDKETAKKAVEELGEYKVQ